MIATTFDMCDEVVLHRRRRPLRGGWRAAFWFLLPATFGFALFILYPALRGLYVSFTDWNLLRNDGSYIGTENYAELWNDKVFWASLRRTIRYTLINIGSQTVMAVMLAVMMDRLAKSVVVRGVLLIPWLIPNVIVGLLWVWMLDSNLGVINDMLGWVGVDPVRFFSDPGKVIPTLALVNTWKYMATPRC